MLKTGNSWTMRATIYFLVMWVSLGGGADAQLKALAKLPKEAAELKLICEIHRAKLRKPLVQLRDLYVQRLETLQVEEQQKGNLEEVLAIRAEIERVEGSKTEVGGSSLPSLNQARAIYDRESSSLVASIARSEAPLLEKYHAALLAMLNRMASQDRLDDAVAVRSLLDASMSASPAMRLPVRNRNLDVAPSGQLKFSAQVDGTTHLYLRGSEIWYDHTEGGAAPVGRHGGEFPTTLNGESWLPVWNGKITEHHKTGIALPREESAARIKAEVKDGRGSVEVIEQPGADNDFTAKIALHDMSEDGKRFFGSAWLDFELNW